MQQIDALQAIERGEKLEQDTLVRLNQAGLIDVVDVTHSSSLGKGKEYMFVGFTDEGLQLLKQSKVPLVSDDERKIIRAVVRGFLDKHEATSKRELLKQFKSPVTSVLQRLDQSILYTANNTYLNETYLPKANAFHHCGDSAALAFARKSTEIVLRVLRVLFDLELESDIKEQRVFTREEVEKEARTIDSSVEPNMIFTGLYLAQEFSVFSTTKSDDQQLGIVSFSLNEHILDTRDMDWDEHIRRSNVYLVVDWKKTRNDSFLTAVPSSHGLVESFSPLPDTNSRKVFLVHGHDQEPKQAVAAFLRSLSLEVIILHEQANQGQTIIEKFEKHSDVRFAVVLLTPDDAGASVQHPEKTRRRARQNVILELGYFLAKLGRNNVCCLYVEEVELPSDYDGVLYVSYDQGGAWRSKLMKELTAAGIEVDQSSEKASPATSLRPYIKP